MGRSWQGGGKMLSVDFDFAGVRVNVGIGLAWQRAVAVFRKATLFSCKAALAAKSDANYYWCDSY